MSRTGHRLSCVVEDVWAACTEPERMVRWIGTWSGDPASGEIECRMTAEGEDAPAEVFDVERCEPPHGFWLRGREAAPFHDELGAEMVANVGTGWDHYLDRLTAHLTGTPVDEVAWPDYEPGSDYYRDLFTDEDRARRSQALHRSTAT